MKDQAGFSLIEIVVVVAIVGILLGIGAGPFFRMYSDSSLEDRASALQEAFKWAQTRAMTGGEADVANGRIIRQRVYFAVNPGNNSYRVIGWRDSNANMMKEASEYTLLQEGFLGGARFGILRTVNKSVRNGAAPTESIFSSSACPEAAEIPLLAGCRCLRFDSKAFLSESVSNADLYITNGTKNCAVSIDAAGNSSLYRWTGSAWQFVR